MKKTILVISTCFLLNACTTENNTSIVQGVRDQWQESTKDMPKQEQELRKKILEKLIDSIDPIFAIYTIKKDGLKNI